MNIEAQAMAGKILAAVVVGLLAFGVRRLLRKRKEAKGKENPPGKA